MACSSLWRLLPAKNGVEYQQQRPVQTGGKGPQRRGECGMSGGRSAILRMSTWRDVTPGAGKGLEVRSSSSKRWQAGLSQQFFYSHTFTEGAIRIRCSSWLRRGGIGGRQFLALTEVLGDRQGGRLVTQALKDNADSKGSLRVVRRPSYPVLELCCHFRTHPYVIRRERCVFAPFTPGT